MPHDGIQLYTDSLKNVDTPTQCSIVFGQETLSRDQAYIILSSALFVQNKPARRWPKRTAIMGFQICYVTIYVIQLGL